MSLKQKIHHKVTQLTHRLQGYVDHSWFSFILGFLAFIDYFIFVIPMDGILISSVMLRTRKWLSFAVSSTIGSSLGAYIFFYIVSTYGLNWLINMHPTITEGAMWSWSLNFFNTYGVLLVFFIAATPLMQQPVVALAALAHTPFIYIFFAILTGRLIKYLIIAYISSHSPHLLSKLWGLKEELHEVGIDLEEKKSQ